MPKATRKTSSPASRRIANSTPPTWSWRSHLQSTKALRIGRVQLRSTLKLRTLGILGTPWSLRNFSGQDRSRAKSWKMRRATFLNRKRCRPMTNVIDFFLVPTPILPNKWVWRSVWCRRLAVKAVQQIATWLAIPRSQNRSVRCRQSKSWCPSSKNASLSYKKEYREIIWIPKRQRNTQSLTVSWKYWRTSTLNSTK